MRSTGKSRDERLLAAAVALTVNGLIAWALLGLLTPEVIAVDDSSLQVVWITAPAPRQVEVRRPTRGHSRAHSPQVREVHALDPSPRAQPRMPTPAAATSPEVIPTRSMSAVYLQQARQWSQAQPAISPPADPFANRHVALRDQARTRFRLARSSPADTLAKISTVFGGAGYTTDDCGAIDERMLGLVVAGDDRAVQQDLDYERRNCRR